MSGGSLLLDQFQEFHRELLRSKTAVELGMHSRAAEVPSGEEGESTPPGPEVVARELRALLERQALQAGRRGTEFATLYKDAQYVMAALGDETFVHMDWAGKSAWRSNLLEFQLFESYVAGEVVFERIDKILERQDPVYHELATVYLLALALGFRGKYWGRDDGGELSALRSRLYRFVYGRDPELIGGGRRIVPDSYAFTVSGGPVKRFPGVWKWALLLVGLLLGFGLLSHRIWRQGTADLADQAQQIQQLQQTGGR